MSIVAAIRGMLDRGLSIEEALVAAELIEAHREYQREVRKAQRRLLRIVTPRDDGNVVKFPVRR